MRGWGIAIGLTVLIATATGAYASANTQADYQIGISGFVPLNCHADVTGTPAKPSSGLVDLGTLRKSCNNSAGYQVWVDSAPGISNAAFYIDGRRVALSSTGSTMISSSSTAATRLRRLQLAGNGLQAISIRVVAL